MFYFKDILIFKSRCSDLFQNTNPTKTIKAVSATLLLCINQSSVKKNLRLSKQLLSVPKCTANLYLNIDIYTSIYLILDLCCEMNPVLLQKFDDFQNQFSVQ